MPKSSKHCTPWNRLVERKPWVRYITEMEVSVPFHISSPALLLMYITTVVVICATLSQTADFFLKFLSSVTFCIELCSSIPPVTPAAMAMGLTIAHCTSKTLPCCTTRLAHQQKSYFGVWTNSTEGYWYREPPSLNFVLSRASCAPQSKEEVSPHSRLPILTLIPPSFPTHTLPLSGTQNLPLNI